ncbi:MAG: dihydrolipoyl dehydrogenase [Desulfarculaceae bacterium]|jgi:dihydrolipoamide dehydrogenase
MSVKVTVIGAGPGGYQAAIRAAQLGAQVNVVEKAQVGGTCLHWGCIPTKTLRATADALETARRLSEFGISGGGEFACDLEAIRQRMANVVKPQAQGIEKLFQAYGVRLVQGVARLSAPDLVEVELAQGGSEQLASDRIILATGSRPADLPGLTRDGKMILNSDDALRLEQIPSRMAVVGGGVIGCEFAFILAALGSQVTVIEALDRILPLPSLDEQCSKLLAREMKKNKIQAITGMVVEKCQQAGSGLKLQLGPSPLVEHPKGREPKPRELEVDQALVSVGRALNTQDLGLSQAGVELDERGAIKVDRFMATSQPGIFAVGDMLGPGRPMLAHMAATEGVAAAANCLGLNQEVSYQVVPAVAFTKPEVAWVGLSPAQAQESGCQVQTEAFAFRMLGKSQAMGEIAGQCKLVSEAESGRLLGAHIIGPHAGDLIHECALALKMGARVGDLAHTIHAHPTLSEAVHEAAEGVLGLCVHTPPKRQP